jgi:hypothetical protein
MCESAQSMRAVCDAALIPSRWRRHCNARMIAVWNFCTISSREINASN